ncbi:hypothetical protein A3860_00075 [Niastella vici]|uniref:Uncharacterized protein n=1 Tax=Niastella vici TaxID=1703345 RepID=A0A1V9G843_9BACT|nr:hypothetical protein A3860_00075 [Niastella vici]
MITVVAFLIYALGLAGCFFVLVSLFSFVTGAIEKNRKRISFAGKTLLWGIGILIVWVVIVFSILSRMGC